MCEEHLARIWQGVILWVEDTALEKQLNHLSLFTAILLIFF